MIAPLSRILAVLMKEFIQMRRDRLTFAMMIGIPLVQLLLFGYAINTDPRHLPTLVELGDDGPAVRAIVQAINVEPLAMVQLIGWVLGVPLALGMLVGHKFPGFAARADKPARWVSLLIFLVFVGIAFSRNGGLFIEHATAFAGLVILHNALALGLGWAAATWARLPEDQRRAVILEVGIQNSGLGLIILFSFYPNLGGMMLITAFWGVWHLVSGLVLSAFWSRRPPQLGIGLV